MNLIQILKNIIRTIAAFDPDGRHSFRVQAARARSANITRAWVASENLRPLLPSPHSWTAGLTINLGGCAAFCKVLVLELQGSEINVSLTGIKM